MRCLYFPTSKQDRDRVGEARLAVEFCVSCLHLSQLRNGHLQIRWSYVPITHKGNALGTSSLIGAHLLEPLELVVEAELEK